MVPYVYGMYVGVGISYMQAHAPTLMHTHARTHAHTYTHMCMHCIIILHNLVENFSGLE